MDLGDQFFDLVVVVVALGIKLKTLSPFSVFFTMLFHTEQHLYKLLVIKGRKRQFSVRTDVGMLSNNIAGVLN